MLTYKHDMYLWHCTLMGWSKDYTFQKFQLECCEQVVFCHGVDIPIIASTNVTVTYHTLSHHTL